MRPVYAIPLVMLCALSFGVSMSQVKLYLSSYLTVNETYQMTAFNLPDGEYYIINLNNTPSLILYAPLNGSLSTLDSEAEIKNALVGYYASQGVTNETELNENDVKGLLYLIDSYNKTRGSELDCRKLIGLDRFSCVDRDTCWRACYTPVCRQMLSNGGEEFIRDIWAFSNSSSYVDSNLSALYDVVTVYPDLNTPGKVDKLITLVNTSEKDSVLMGENNIFNMSSVGFCSPLNYNLSYLDQARAILDKKYLVFQLRAADETGYEILGRTNQRISLRNEMIESSSGINASQYNPFEVGELLDQTNIPISEVFIIIFIVSMAVVVVADLIIIRKELG